MKENVAILPWGRGLSDGGAAIAKGLDQAGLGCNGNGHRLRVGVGHLLQSGRFWRALRRDGSGLQRRKERAR